MSMKHFERLGMDLWRPPASAVVLAGRKDLAPRAVKEFGSKLVLQTLGASWDSVSAM